MGVMITATFSSALHPFLLGIAPPSLYVLMMGILSSQQQGGLKCLILLDTTTGPTLAYESCSKGIIWVLGKKVISSGSLIGYMMKACCYQQPSLLSGNDTQQRGKQNTI